MRIAIFENIMTPGGHEVDFDRLLTEELKTLGHSVSFYVPEGFRFSLDYGVPTHELNGEVVSYSGVTGLKKFWRTLTRERRRLGWYRQLYAAATDGKFDALIVPTSTYRYLRALSRSVLRKSPVPLIFILHGINPKEAPKFLQGADSLRNYPKICPTVITLAADIFGESRESIRLIPPPTYTPRDIDWQPGEANFWPQAPRLQNFIGEGSLDSDTRPLLLGFFGQFRREKRLEDFLRTYLSANFRRPAKLLVQGSTMHPEDAVAFTDIIHRYQKEKSLVFWHKGLVGYEWQEAIAAVDALLMPYSAPRYLYHWGGMLFTAIGYQKPMVASDDMNPEVFSRFPVGETFKSGDLAALKTTLENFVNNFGERQPLYAQALREAAAVYSPGAFARRLTQIMEEHRCSYV
ncbi:MAG: glycosyltransferase [Selenomonadaceae bacterium]|nr:glycosyltransferase [Selenomonadaceae bacterium]